MEKSSSSERRIPHDLVLGKQQEELVLWLTGPAGAADQKSRSPTPRRHLTFDTLSEQCLLLLTYTRSSEIPYINSTEWIQMASHNHWQQKWQ